MGFARANGRHLVVARGFASMQEEWDWYLHATKHFQEVDDDVASFAATHPRPRTKNIAPKAWAQASTS
eukprot:1692938-Amphidinium_carterae.1